MYEEYKDHLMKLWKKSWPECLEDIKIISERMKISEKEVCEEFKDTGKEYTDEEFGYRRGYLHGFVWGRLRPDVTEEEVKRWRYDMQEVCPPGTPMAGQLATACLKDDLISDDHEGHVNR